MNLRVNHREVKMSKKYIRCLHCGELKLVDNCCLVRNQEGVREGRDGEGVAVVGFGVCEVCQSKSLNTGRKNFMKNDWSQIFLKNRLDD